ncbi:DUF1107 domain-containing protein [Vibrio sp. SS-MA-C1-2]|uniref:DUF1107 family protein n=1 Tax=Vibrio sp. SS-MA-C1-2 TaxID=2908646 RepID=UPI001F3D7505|nr:DUF1107 family protein [Vibrio sp. SS-MA-C1-2]UJF19041.1 DUF1107 domain-containing protein [Vibrio sp. SS-MA-C1-2]
MRMFKQYIPSSVAKHISRLFKGRLYIDGRGGYEFNHGQLQIPANPKEHHYLTVKEVNQEIDRLRSH